MIGFYLTTTGEYSPEQIADISNSIILDDKNKTFKAMNQYEFEFQKLSADYKNITADSSREGLSIHGAKAMYDDLFGKIPAGANLERIESSINTLEEWETVVNASVDTLNSSINSLETWHNSVNTSIADINSSISTIKTDYIPNASMGVNRGVATLDASGRVPSSQLPSYVDDIIEGYLYNEVFYEDAEHQHAITGEGGKIYVDLTTNTSWRWGGSQYTQVSESLAIGETEGTAYDGSKGKALKDAFDLHKENTDIHITADERTSWNNASVNSHTHDNKSALDSISSTDVANWNDASSKKHTHANKTTLDKITETDYQNLINASNAIPILNSSVSSLKNYVVGLNSSINSVNSSVNDKFVTVDSSMLQIWQMYYEMSLADAAAFVDINNHFLTTDASINNHIDDDSIHITSAERTSWNSAATNSHSHSNKSILDGITDSSFHTHTNTSILNGITDTSISNWNNAEQNVNPDWNATSGDASILNKPTLGTAAAKNISTGIASGSTSSELPTAEAVATFVEGKGYTTNTGTVTKVTAGTGLDGGDITTTGTISLAESGATAGRYGQSSNASVNYNGDVVTVNIPDISVDAYGRVTAISNKTLKVKDTDTNTTYTFAGGTNKFTVTPSSGSAQDVTVTPSIDNNVTANGNFAANAIVVGNGDNQVAKNSGVTISTSEPSSGSGDTTVPTSKAVWSAISSGIAVNDAMIYKGTIAGGSTGAYGALTVAANKGETYKVTTAGKINGVAVEVGDMLICNTDSTAAATSDNYSTIVANWDFIQTNLDGVVIGPASVTDNHVATFDGTTGKLIKDSGYTIAKSVPADAKFTDNNTTYKFTIGTETKGDSEGTDLGTLKSEAAATDGTTLSLVTTGEKAIWNAKTSNTGTVTSVGMSVPTGLSVSGSPVTTSGTLAVTMESGYKIPLDSSLKNFQAAYAAKHSHSNSGILNGLTDASISNWNNAEQNVNPDWSATSGDASILNKPTLGTAAAKNVSTGIAAGSTSGDLPTAKAVATFVEGKGYTTNTGTVTSVGMTVPTGLKVTNSPVTTSGTLEITTDSGYVIPLDASLKNFLTAYSNSHTHSNKSVLDGITSTDITNWNDASAKKHSHSNSGILNGLTDTSISNWNKAEQNVNPDWNATSGDASILNKPTLGTAAAKNVSTGIAAGSTSGDLPTAKAVATFVEGKGYTTNTGTVTSVAMTVPTGLSISGTPVTTSGTFAVTLTSGYKIPLDASLKNFQSAYSNSHTHSNKSTLDGISATDITNWNDASTKKHSHTNSGILNGLTDTSISNWNKAEQNVNPNWTATSGDASILNRPNLGTAATQNTSSGIAAGSTSSDLPTAKAVATFVEGKGYTTNTGTVTKVTAGTGLSGGDITTTGTISLATSGVTAGRYGQTSNASVNQNGDIVTVNIPDISVDTYGRVTAISNKTLKVKDWNTTYSKGTLADLNTGTATANRLWDASTISHYVAQELTSGVQYKDDFNASTGVIGTGTSTLTTVSESKGDMYVVSTAGTYAGTELQVGDSIIFKKDVAAGTAPVASDITFVQGTVKVVDKNATLAWNTSTAIAEVEGVTVYVKMPAKPTKSDVGLGNVDNKSSATIRSEITATNVSTALGYIPASKGDLGSYVKNSSIATSVTASDSSIPTSNAVKTFVEGKGYTTNTGTVREVSTGTGLTGGPITSTGKISLATSGATAGRYGQTSDVSVNQNSTVVTVHIPDISVDAYGRVTAISNHTLKVKDWNTTYTFDGTYNATSNKAATVSTVTNSYVANLHPATTVNYITEPEFKTVKINGSTTNAASSENCVMQYDTTNKCLKFIFN